jgi:hypothetical protein
VRWALPTISRCWHLPGHSGVERCPGWHLDSGYPRRDRRGAAAQCAFR